MSTTPLLPKVLGWLSALLVTGAIVVGFLVVGSPVEARKRKADGERIDGLSAIAQAVRQQAAQGKDPHQLAEISGLSKDQVKDPVTGKPYDYSRIDHLHFELCASFETDTSKDSSKSESDSSGYYGSQEAIFKTHTKGRNCFKLNVKDKPTY